MLWFFVRFQDSEDLKSLVEINVCSLNALLEDVKDFVKNQSSLPRYT